MQRTAITLAYLFLSVICLAQQYPFVHYTPKDGLVNSRVRKAYQDSKGRMYFLTAGGLSVYDGARFRNYSTRNGLPVDIVNDILEVSDDSLLIAANTGALNALVHGRIVAIKTEGNHCPTINQFYRSGNTIFLACDEGLFSLENKKITALNISSQLTIGELPYLGNISGIENYLVLTTHELRGRIGLYLYDIKNNRICDALNGIEAYLLGKDRSNKIWISNKNKLFVLDNSALVKGKLVITSPSGHYSQAKDLSTINMGFDENSVWMIVRENSKNKEIRHIENNGGVKKIPLPEQATVSDIKNIFLDRENNIWLCNDGEGVFKIARSPLQVFENPVGRSKSGNISAGSVFGDVIWFRSTTNKLFRQSQEGMKEFSCNLKQAPIVIFNSSKKILARDFNTVYEGHITNDFISFQKSFSIDANDLFAGNIRVDRNGCIIAAQKNSLSVWKNASRIMELPLVKNDNIQELVFDKNNLLWVVRRHEGIEVFTTHPEQPANYLHLVHHFSPEQIIGSPRSFVIDKSGMIWIGTRDHGLIAYEQQGERLKKRFQFNTSNGLADNFITALACDSFNNIIVGTQTGLDRILFNPDTSHRIENLSRSSNFFAFINQAWADKDQAYALTYSGVLLQISPLITEKISVAPQLLLEEMKVNAATIPTGRENFGHTENNINFFVAAPSFIDEKQVAYSYLLEGSGNKQWSDTNSTNSVINLTNLSAGNYVLKMKAFFPSANYAPAELSYGFKIEPAWWQTWWFKAGIGILGIGVLIIVIRFYYKRKLEKQKNILEKQQVIEKERTRIATDMHDDLGAGLSRIKFLSETIGIKKQKQQPIEEDISKIREYSHEMIDKMGEIVWALNEKNDSLSDLLSYSRSYAVEYLAQNGIECEVKAPDNFPAIFVSGEFRRNIFLTMKEALHNIVKHAQASNVKMRIEIDNNLMIILKDDGIGFDKNSLRPFRNGLSNMEKRMKDIGGSIQIKNESGSMVVMIAPMKK